MAVLDEVESAGVVLAGGSSRRMGTPKADLEWHGSTLLQRTVEVLARVTGRVIVVGAAGRQPGALLVQDPEPGLGPMQGLATGLAAAADLGAAVAFVCSTDLPFLHPAYVRRVLAALDDETDVVLPVAGGYRQPLAAAYRTSLAAHCALLVAQRRLKPAFLLAEVRTRVLDDAALLADPALAAADPGLSSVVNVNTPAEYASAQARPAPLVTLLPAGVQVRAGTVAGLGLPSGVEVGIDGRPAGPATVLVEGDVVTVSTSG